MLHYLGLLCNHLEDCFYAGKSDNVPAYTTKLIKKWFEFTGVNYIKACLCNNLDLNPIENLW